MNGSQSIFHYRSRVRHRPRDGASALAGSSETFEELRGCYDSDAFEGIQNQQILISRYNGVRFPFECNFQQLIVVGIAADLDASGGNDFFSA